MYYTIDKGPHNESVGFALPPQHTLLIHHPSFVVDIDHIEVTSLIN